MKLIVDRETDALYFRLGESRIVESEEIRPGIILDNDEDDHAVGIEILNISEHASKEELSSMLFRVF